MQVYALLFLNLFSVVNFTLNTILSFVWVIVLFKYSIQLRRKVKCSNLVQYNQDACLEAMNTKVEYVKSLFFFSIVFVELISAILSVASAGEMNVYAISDIINQNHPQNQTTLSLKFFSSNISHTFHNNQINCTHSLPFLWEFLNYNISRILIAGYQVSLVFVFSPVYVLLSYYSMIIKNSLNNSYSLKSIDLAREQKILVLCSFVMCLVLLVLIVRVELYLLFKFVQSCIAIIQLVLTFYYSSKFVRVLKWKIMDTKIAFGKEHFQFKRYTKSLKSFERYFFIYKVVVISFCTYILIHSLKVTAMYLHPAELYRIFGLCLNFQQLVTYTKVLTKVTQTLLVVQIIPLYLTFIGISLLNLSTIPFLLSKINLRCRFNLKFPKAYDESHLSEPLLN